MYLWKNYKHFHSCFLIAYMLVTNLYNLNNWSGANRAIWHQQSPTLIPHRPRRIGRWARQFEDKWQYPNCIGAIDGKHIAICAPANSGSMFHNYKMFYSIVLMTVVDASYRFLIVDVGANGRSCDAGVFGNSAMATALENGTLGIKKMPFVIVGDEAFGLKTYMMKPYPTRQLSDDERIFNYRLSKARRVSENVFSILSNRFRVLDKHIYLSEKRHGDQRVHCTAKVTQIRQTQGS